MTGGRGVLALLIAWASAQAPSVPGSPATVRVSVVSNAGTPVGDLDAEDFAVSVAGRRISHQMLATTPATFVVLIDTSSSVPLSERHIRRLVLEGFVQSLKDSDQAFVGSVSGAARQEPAPVAKASLANAAAVVAKTQTSPTEPSPLWDALVHTSQWIRTRTKGPASVLLVTDGRATANRCGVNDAVKAMLASHIAVSVLSMGEPAEVVRSGNSSVSVDANRILRQVAETTGGQFIEGALTRMRGLFGDVSKLDTEVDRDRDALRKWVPLARAHYVLRLDVPADTASARVEVRVRRPGVTVRASRVASVADGLPTCRPARK